MVKPPSLPPLQDALVVVAVAVSAAGSVITIGIVRVQLLTSYIVSV